MALRITVADNTQIVAAHFGVTIEEARILLKAYPLEDLLSSSITLSTEANVSEPAVVTTGTTVDDLAAAFADVERRTPKGARVKLTLYTEEKPTEEEIAEFYLKMVADGFHVEYPSVQMVEGVPTTTIVLENSSPFLLALIPILPTLFIVGLIAFGIANISNITSSLMPIIVTVVVGSVVLAIGVAIALRKPAERAVTAFLPSGQQNLLPRNLSRRDYFMSDCLKTGSMKDCARKYREQFTTEYMPSTETLELEPQTIPLEWEYLEEEDQNPNTKLKYTRKLWFSRTRIGDRDFSAKIDFGHANFSDPRLHGKYLPELEVHEPRSDFYATLPRFLNSLEEAKKAIETEIIRINKEGHENLFFPQTELREKVRELWVKALEYDGFPPDSKFVVFSDENPYLKQYEEEVGKLLRFKEFQAGQWQPDTRKGYKCHVCPDILMNELLAKTVKKQSLGLPEMLERLMTAPGRDLTEARLRQQYGPAIFLTAQGNDFITGKPQEEPGKRQMTITRKGIDYLQGVSKGTKYVMFTSGPQAGSIVEVSSWEREKASLEKMNIAPPAIKYLPETGDIPRGEGAGYDVDFAQRLSGEISKEMQNPSVRQGKQQVARDLVNSVREEEFANVVYQERAARAIGAGDFSTGALYQDVAGEERGHALKFTGRLDAIGGAKLAFVPDTAEYVADTIEELGLRDKIDNAFATAIERVRK